MTGSAAESAPAPYEIVIDYLFGPTFEAAPPTTNPGDLELEGLDSSR